MTDYTVYDTETGVIRSILLVSDPADAALNVPNGCALLEGRFEPETYYIRDSAALPFPPRSNPWAVWTGTEWSDPRTPADLAAALTARRNVTALDKSDLLIRLRLAKILTSEEAKAAGRGEIPARLLDMMGPLPEDARDAAEIKWAADTTISRTHPVIVAAAYALGISDEQLDQIFGVPA